MEKIKIQIKSFGGSVLFEYESKDNTIKKTLEKAIEKNANLSFANLSSADLRSADLSFADLRSANLSSADLRYADLSFADLRYADLSFADLRSANLSSANLRSADLSSAKGFKINPCMLNILKSQKGKLRAFKYLNGNSSPYQNSEYKVGETYSELIKNCEKDERISCGKGLNVATLEWCLIDTSFNVNKAYIEVEFDVKDIIAIPYASDGKFRVKKLKVIRKLTKKELKKYC